MNKRLTYQAIYTKGLMQKKAVQNQRRYFVLCQGAETASSIDYLRFFATQARDKRTRLNGQGYFVSNPK